MKPGAEIASHACFPEGGRAAGTPPSERPDPSSRSTLLLETGSPADAIAPALLRDLNLPPDLTSDEFDQPLVDLRAVLEADYRQAPGFPPVELARELLRIVESRVKPYGEVWRCWQDRQNLDRLQRVFNWGDVVVNAQPYERGTGLSLWGFSCEAKAEGRNKFVIFLNTAHDPGVVAATVGHELGHYIYSTIADDNGEEQSAMGTIFTQHLTQVQELFSDAVVALSAYSHPVVRQIVGAGQDASCGTDSRIIAQIREAFATIDPQYKIDLAREGITPPWRVRYLTLMIHFFKLRCALLDAVGI